jgi:hypothetical protein
VLKPQIEGRLSARLKAVPFPVVIIPYPND